MDRHEGDAATSMFHNLVGLSVSLYRHRVEPIEEGGVITPPIAYSPLISESCHTPRLLSRQPPPASVQFSFKSSTGGPHANGARSKFSARQSPSSQSRLICQSENVVVISHTAPDRRKFRTTRSILANDRCTRPSRQRMASQRGSASRVNSAG